MGLCPADHPAARGARRRAAAGAARARHALLHRRAARPHHRPRGADGAGPRADRRRGLGRGDRAAPAGARHPRRPAAAAGPPRDGPRPGPAAARHRPGGRRAPTVAEALAQTRETLAELRALSRGIAPPILADRGLRGALAALAGRSTVPVELDVGPASDAADRPARPGGREHRVLRGRRGADQRRQAQPRHRVRRSSLERHGATWSSRSRDNGVGGAHVAKGHGLAGLADRVRAAGGVLAVDSPPVADRRSALTCRVTAARCPCAW